jgi:hypothetical protein
MPVNSAIPKLNSVPISTYSVSFLPLLFQISKTEDGFMQKANGFEMCCQYEEKNK